MAGGGDQGFFLGMMAARRARERRGEGQTGRSSGGGALFNIFPKMVIPVIIYAVVAFIGGREAMDSILFEVPMVSNVDWGLTTGDLLLVLGLVFLFIELVKSAGSGTATIVNHGLSMVVFVVCLALFLLVGQFATSTFFVLMFMTLTDVVAGFVVTIVAARRDLAVGDG
tara:strand:+ start:931 stop:1437 length:507 start_codon:yes stop_codon:yes gene_type:complete